MAHMRQCTLFVFEFKKKNKNKNAHCISQCFCVYLSGQSKFKDSGEI